MNWERLRENQFEDAIKKSGGLCVIPIGCLEKHGQHLPVGTDSVRARTICERAAEIEDVVIFPNTMWLGDVCSYHRVKPDRVGPARLHGGIGVNPVTLLSVYIELCEEIRRNGFRKILFINCHGGNVAFLDFLTRAINWNPLDYAVMWASASGYFLKLDEIYKRAQEQRDRYPELTEEDMAVLAKFAETGPGGAHADIRETAQLLAIDPETVAPENYTLESGLSTHRMDHLENLGIHYGLAWGANYPNMYNGFAPVGVSPAIGKVMMDAAVERVALIFKTLKEDEECVRVAMGAKADN